MSISRKLPLVTPRARLLSVLLAFLPSALASAQAPAPLSLPARNASRSMVAASRLRLEVFDVPRGVLAEIDRTGVAQRAITITSPQRGTVVEKRAVPGLAVDPMTALYVVADLGRVWVLADVQERDMAQVKLGQEARRTVEALPGRTLAGKVAFVSPTVDDATRTAKARIEFDNAAGLLKPGMYANVLIDVDVGSGIAIPEDAGSCSSASTRSSCETSGASDDA